MSPKTSVKFPTGSRYSLVRTRDGAGDSGPMLVARNTADETLVDEIKVGYNVTVGSYMARSYSAQDYWMTTLVTEILSEEGTEDGKDVRFKTGNSEYVLRSF